MKIVCHGSDTIRFWHIHVLNFKALVLVVCRMGSSMKAMVSGSVKNEVPEKWEGSTQGVSKSLKRRISGVPVVVRGEGDGEYGEGDLDSHGS